MSGGMKFILEHYKNPRNYGDMDNPDIAIEEGNPYCGDIIKLYLKIEDGRVEDVSFKGEGCTISIAGASLLTEMIKGKTLEEIRKIGKEEMLKAFRVPINPVRIRCALLALKVLRSGLFGIKSWPGEEEGGE
jgi:nitrogen fixation NifU-like protein